MTFFLRNSIFFKGFATPISISIKTRYQCKKGNYMIFSDAIFGCNFFLYNELRCILKEDLVFYVSGRRRITKSKIITIKNTV